VAFVCLVTLYLVQDAARRVRVLVQVAEQSSSGDHAADAPPLGEDEVGRLGEAWNGVLATIRHLLGEEKAARVRLETLLAGVSETANGISAAAAQLLAGTTEQTAAAQQQAEAVAQTVSTVNEVAETSRQAAERAPSVADAANRAVEIARAGRKAVDDTVVGLRSVKDQVQAITEGDHGPGRTRPGHRRDHVHREGPRGADEPPGPQRRHRGLARRRAGQGVRGGGG
jgi:methyl-accepting chemotaxis protein